MEHTLHERTASIAQLVVQGMGVLEISNAQQFNSVEVFFTAGNQVQNTLCHIPQHYTPRLKVSEKKKKFACTAEPLYIRKTVLWAAELMRPGFLWVVSNGQIPRCLKRCKLLFSHIEVLTLQYGFAFNISLPKALGRGRTGKAQQQSRFPVSSCLFSGY